MLRKIKLYDDASEYDEEVMKCCRENELKNRPHPSYMSKQPHLTHKNRTLLFDWLSHICDHYHLSQVVWSLSLNYFDRYLSLGAVVTEEKSQLLVIACLFIAWKIDSYRNIREVKEMAELSENGYSCDQILEMEASVLQVLNFNVTPPTVGYFCYRFLKEFEANPNIALLSMYFLQLMMVDGERSLVFLPSEIAASCVIFARMVSHLEPWNKKLEKVSGYTYEQLTFCVIDVYLSVTKRNSLQQYIYERYASKRYNKVAEIKIFPLDHYISTCTDLLKKL